LSDFACSWEQDEIFPVADTKRLASVLQTDDVPAELIIFSGLLLGLVLERGAVYCSIGNSAGHTLTGNWRKIAPDPSILTS
jgi:hypothetical protein